MIGTLMLPFARTVQTIESDANAGQGTGKPGKRHLSSNGANLCHLLYAARQDSGCA
jgi:hypothetical protein